MNQEELKAKLGEEAFNVTQNKATEMPFTGKYLNNHEKGMYTCVVCGFELFDSNTKFDSGTGWPSFTDPSNTANIELQSDTSYGMTRTEVMCKNCGAHLGHVFDDGPKDKGGKRFCINSCSLNFNKHE